MGEKIEEFPHTREAICTAFRERQIDVFKFRGMMRELGVSAAMLERETIANWPAQEDHIKPCVSKCI